MSLVIDRVHCGPPESGNGGWTAGLLAQRLLPDMSDRAVEVRLSSPPPLDRELEVTLTRDRAVLLDGPHVVATAHLTPPPELDPVEPATSAEAALAEDRFEGWTDHVFPSCFACGTDRSPDEALCLRPGPLADGTGRYAARWTPREASVPLVWAALDCPGGWASGVAGRPMVLGSMTAQVHALPTPGEGHVITSWQLASEGRKHFSTSMLHAAGGQLCAVATAIWIAVHPQSVRPVGHQSGDGR